MPQVFQTRGCVAVITGAGSGIGRALCGTLLRQGAARILAADIDACAAAATAAALDDGTRVIRPWPLDSGDEAAVAQAVARISSEFGPIDLWCSNAGLHQGRGIGAPEDWTASIAVNLLAHVHAARHVLPHMVARGRGHFLITASAAGLLTDLRAATYAATKHAAVAFAEWLSITHDAAGVTIACVCPEGVRTAMTAADSPGDPSAFLAPEAVAEAMLDGLREGRFLILTHPRTAEFELRRAGDRERWLIGMRRARERSGQRALASTA